MKVITVATDKIGYYYSLQETTTKLGYELITLGYGLKWKGFGWRLKLIINYLKTLEDVNEIVMIVDAYDVIFIRKSEDALNIFHNMNIPFLCGAFRKLDGVLGIVQEQEFGKSKKNIPYPYNNLCAGTLMSKVKTILKLYDNIQIKDNDDDQIILNKLFDRQEEEYIILPDYNFQIFCTTFPHIFTKKIRDIDKIRVTSKNTVICDITGTEPVLIHGLANTKLDSILKELKFEHCTDLSTYNYNLDKIFYHIKLILKIIFRKFLN